MKFLIPSKGRSDRIHKVLDILGKKNLYVYVHESEYDKYLPIVGKQCLKTHNVKGMAAIRKFMYNDNKKENYICQVDDDFGGMIYRFDGSQSLELIVDSKHIRSVIENSYYVANDMKTPYFTYDGVNNPTFYNALKLTKFSGVSAMFGIIPSLMGDIDFDTRFKIMEDYDLLAHIKSVVRYVFVDLRYAVRFHDTYTQEGGCSTIRSMTDLETAGNLLRKKYGSSSVKKDKLQYNLVFSY